MQQAVEAVKDRVAFAIPDPHIGRWLLLDPTAFKAVLGTPCQTPDQKCSRDRYKQLLAEAVLQTGVTPVLGGVEHAEDLVNAMNLDPRGKRDDFREFLEELRSVFPRWRTKPNDSQ